MKWTHHPIECLNEWLPAWQNLLARTSNSPLLEPEFIIPLLEHFGMGQERLVCCGEPDAPVAIAIMRPHGRFAWETFQPSQAPLGVWLHDPQYSITQLMTGIFQALPGVTLVAGITQQDPDQVSRPACGRNIETLDYIQTARVSIQGTFDEYWNKRGKNLRQNMKKQRNKLEKANIVTRLEILRQPEQMAQAVADYGLMESKSWKSEEDTAIHPDNAQGRFYQAMLEAFCSSGKGCVYRYYFGDQLAATDLCIENNNTLIILKTTFDESIMEGMSPAFLMRQEVFGQLFEEKRLERVEFYGRVMEWHTRWTDEIRTMYHLNGYRFSALPKLKRMLKKR
jgi:CelD/BcsL family acetyltransferase involved in cellulose biosynthesis